MLAMVITVKVCHRLYHSPPATRKPFVTWHTQQHDLLQTLANCGTQRHNLLHMLPICRKTEVGRNTANNQGGVNAVGPQIDLRNNSADNDHVNVTVVFDNEDIHDHSHHACNASRTTPMNKDNSFHSPFRATTSSRTASNNDGDFEQYFANSPSVAFS